MWKNDSPRILISRMSAVGDTILTLPVACALRRKFPQAFFGWVVEQRASQVVQGHELVDEVIVLERGWFASPAKIWQARQVLRPFNFDISIDCQSITKSALACYLAGATTRIGCRGKYGCELSPYLNNVLIEPRSSHLTDRSLELLAPLGIRTPQTEWGFPIPESAVCAADQALKDVQLDGSYAVINPGANWDSRLWEMDRFSAVAHHLGERHGLKTLVVWGNQREHDWAREIVAGAREVAVLAPSTDLAQLAELIRRGRIFVSADTGPMHLAVAVGTPTISLHGVTLPQESGPFGPPHRSVQVRHDAFSRRERKKADNSAMRLITPELVNQHCDELIAETGHQGEQSAA